MLALCVMPGFACYGALMQTLGKLSTGNSGLYLGKLADVDLDVRELVTASVQHMRAG